MSDAVQLLEQALAGGLIHPGTGNGPIALPMPGINNNSIPPEMAEQFAKDAGLPHSNIPKLIAEALANALQAGGAALAEDITTRTKAADVQPVTAPTPPQQAMPEPATTGNMTVTVNGQILMTDLGDWQRKPPQQIADALRQGAQPNAWTKALLMAITDAATGSQATWTMNVQPGRIDITTHAEEPNQNPA